MISYKKKWIHHHHLEQHKDNCNKKNGRLNTRRRLLFKHPHIERNDVVAHHCRLLAREAHQVKSTVMCLQRMQSTHLEKQLEQQNLVSARNIDNLSNVDSILYNIIPLLTQ